MSATYAFPVAQLSTLGETMPELPASAPTVFIVDDDEGMRKMLTAMVRTMGLDAVAFATGTEFLAAHSAERAGCLILDLRMPGMSGLELLDRLRTEGIELPALFITGHGDVPAAVQAMKAGAIDFLEKPFPPEELQRLIRAAVERDATQRRLKRQTLDIDERLATLTEQECNVLNMMIAGKPHKAIANELGVSLRTMYSRQAEVLRKLGANSRHEVIKLVLDHRHHKRQSTVRSDSTGTTGPGDTQRAPQ